MSQLGAQVSHFTFCIRSWASARKSHKPRPGTTTNQFHVLLLIYFLRRQLLPTLDILFNNAGVSLVTGSSWVNQIQDPLHSESFGEALERSAERVQRRKVIRFKSKAKEFLYMGKGMNVLKKPGSGSASVSTSR
ncbi:hypothetical protein Ocin01_14313 [Orchesella cincta]|uniref:Uncharacterized protein n=1 Tax=Orchesella cincta TaxID=48709 RepID=A0A1D2MH96_ORCCI|nr:hypothetical protein Ocin01_14313 [Orchesella cincta]